MTVVHAAALAIDGGTPVRAPDRPLPTIMTAAGHTLGAEEERAVLRVLRSGLLSGAWGPEVPALTTEFAALTGAAHAVACSSGTAAVHLFGKPAPAEALLALAEGVPAIAGYLDRPLYAEPVFREARTYGLSGFPLRGRTAYPDGLCPVAKVHAAVVRP